MIIIIYNFTKLMYGCKKLVLFINLYVFTIFKLRAQVIAQNGSYQLFLLWYYTKQWVNIGVVSVVPGVHNQYCGQNCRQLRDVRNFVIIYTAIVGYTHTL